MDSILNHFDSSTNTMKKYNIINHCRFKNLFELADKVIIADAFLSNRTLEFINDNTRKTDKNIIMKNNYKSSTKRTAIEIKTSPLNPDAIYNVLVESIKKGENNFIMAGSNKKIKKIHNQLISDGILLAKEILILNSESSDLDIKPALGNINEEWIKYRL